MSTISELETAIQQLPASQVDELAVWLEAYRARRAAPLPGWSVREVLRDPA
jgi:hypothetical protein